MSAYLIQNKEISFKQTNVDYYDIDTTAFQTLKRAAVDVEISSENVKIFSGREHQTSTNWVVFSKLKKFLMLEEAQEDAKKIIKIFLQDAPSDRFFENLKVRLQGDFLREVRNVLGKGTRLRLEIIQAKSREPHLDNGKIIPKIISFASKPPNSPFQFSSIPQNKATFDFGLKTDDSYCYTSEMSISLGQEKDSLAYCEGLMALPMNWLKNWKIVSRDKCTFAANVNLIVSVVDKIVFDSDMEKRSILHLNKKLLLEEIQTDLEIIARNGKVIKCHSSFIVELADYNSHQTMYAVFYTKAQSEIIKTMLEAETTATEYNGNNKIPLPDVSEDGVRNLLAYLYSREMDNPLQHCSAAVEMLQVGHTYLVNFLVDDMKNILLDKPCSWFDADSALRLFFFANPLIVHNDLKNKAVDVLKMKPDFTIASEEFNRIFDLTDLNADGDAGAEAKKSKDSNGERLQLAKQLCSALLFSSSSTLDKNT